MYKKIFAMINFVGAIFFITACTTAKPNEPDEHVHEYSEKTYAATCVKRGYNLHTCECGDSYTDGYTVSYTHTYRPNGSCQHCNNISDNAPDSTCLSFSDDYDNGGYSVQAIKKNATETRIKIPATYNGKPVTSILDDAFKNNSSVKSLYIPDSVVDLSYDALAYCTSLTSIRIGSGVTSLEYSLHNCPALLNIEVSPNNPVYAGEGNCIIYKESNSVFLGCVNSTVPDYVEKIEAQAFYNLDKLTEIVLNGVKTIDYYAFSDCENLKTVQLGSNLQEIGSGAFYKCKSLTDIYFDGTETQWLSIVKADSWDDGTPSYTVHFSD